MISAPETRMSSRRLPLLGEVVADRPWDVTSSASEPKADGSRLPLRLNPGEGGAADDRPGAEHLGYARLRRSWD